MSNAEALSVTILDAVVLVELEILV